VNSAINLINSHIGDINVLLNNKVDKKDNYDLMSLSEREKLAGIEEGAQVNIINSVEEENFEIVDKKLFLKDIAISKVSNL
jgi:hypothetical protein